MMKGRPKPSCSQKISNLYRLSKPILPIIGVTVVVGFLAYIFEQLPKHDGQPQTIRQLSHDLWNQVPHPQQFFSLLVKNLGGVLPAWVPLWSISAPRAKFDPRIPPSVEISRDAKLVLPLIKKVVRHPYFRIFKIDLSAECPFWAREDICSSPDGGCSVCECDEDNIPRAWKLKPTENFGDRSSDFPMWGGNYNVEQLDEFSLGLKDFPIIFDTVSDEHSKTASYVDLGVNPVGNTGYGRTPIWSLIYKENCMSDPSNPLAPTAAGAENCREEDAFYRIMSGMQTAISVLVAERYILDKPGKVYDAASFQNPSIVAAERLKQLRPRYNLRFFRDRVATNRDYMENLYFTFSLLLRTMCHAKGIFEQCTCDTGMEVEDIETRLDLKRLLAVCDAPSIMSAGANYLATPIFEQKTSLALRQFRNISRLMDCVDCESCRLHAKIKVLALLQVAKATGEPRSLYSLERNEVIALVNGIGYFAEAVNSVSRFQRRLRALQFLWALGSLIPLAFLLWALQRVNWQNAFQRQSLLRRIARSRAAAAAEEAACELLEDEDLSKTRVRKPRAVPKRR